LFARGIDRSEGELRDVNRLPTKVIDLQDIPPVAIVGEDDGGISGFGLCHHAAVIFIYSRF